MKNKYFLFVLCGACAVASIAATGSTVSKSDVLGRVITSERHIPKAYIKDVKKQINHKSELIKSEVLAKSLNYPSEVEIRKTYGAFEHKNGRRWYTIDDDEGLYEWQYVQRISQIEDDDKGRLSYVKGNYFSFESKDPSTYYYASFNESGKCDGKNSCYEEINGYPHVYLDYKNVLKNSNLYDSFYNKGYKGNGIGISFTEGGVPYAGLFPANKLIVDGDCGPVYYEGPHATNVARVLNRIAPQAILYGYKRDCSIVSKREFVLPVDGYYKNPQVFIGNHSYGSSSGDTILNLNGQPVYNNGAILLAPSGEYARSSRDIDDFIYETRSIQFASIGNVGNTGGAHASKIARGVNVISVGAVNNNLEYQPYSSWKNPTMRGTGVKYCKPEIANFADIWFSEEKTISVYGPFGNKGTKYKYETIKPYFNATSSATPYTAASVALLLDRYPFYKWHPEVVKALLITSSIKKINGAEYHDTDNDGKYAMGVPDGNAMLDKNRSRFWNGNNGDFFDRNKEIRFTEKNIKANRKYRIAISWLSSGTYVYENGQLPQDINLYVYQGNVLKGSSYSKSNPFEMVEINTYTDDNLTIVITRKENFGGRVLLGYNLLELPEEYQPK